MPQGNGSRVARQRALRDLANLQGGYFLARQAQALGYARNHFPRFVATGAWERERHGIYRLAGVPVADPALAELHLWILWTVARADKDARPRGALSYETALVVFGLSDLMHDRVHLWVPKNFRTLVVPPEVRLHAFDRSEMDIMRHDGLTVVKPVPTLLDLLREGRVSREHIEKALKDGLRSGIITRTDLAAAVASDRERQQLHAWLRGVL